MFPSRDIYEFWPPIAQKFLFGLFDQGEIKRVKFPKFSTGESILLRNLKAKVQNVSLQWFLRICTAHWPKISVRSLWQACNWNLGSVIWRCNQIQILKFFHRREYIAPELEGRGPACVYIHRYLRILAAHWPKISAWSFWPGCDHLSQFSKIIHLEWIFCSRTWRELSRMFPSSDIYAFWRPIGRKFRFGLFDQGANMWVKFPKSSTWSEYFALELEGNYRECLPLVIFTCFGRLLAENFSSVFLTAMRLEPGISHLETQPD